MTSPAQEGWGQVGGRVGAKGHSPGGGPCIGPVVCHGRHAGGFTATSDCSLWSRGELCIA